MRRQQGFTLIEMVIVMVILGIMAAIAAPKFIDLTQSAKATEAQGALAAVRGALHIRYGQSASTGNPVFPASLSASDFTSNMLPINKLNGKSGIGTVATAPAGTATHATDGFWYIVATGVAGAYSDGTEDTSGY